MIRVRKGLIISLSVAYYLLNSNETLNIDHSNDRDSDYFRFSNGCEDSEGSRCIDGDCICKDNQTVRLKYGFCLRILSIGDKSMASSQCKQSYSNSACFASHDGFIGINKLMILLLFWKINETLLNLDDPNVFDDY
jgi:hypothetical protein